MAQPQIYKYVGKNVENHSCRKANLNHLTTTETDDFQSGVRPSGNSGICQFNAGKHVQGPSIHYLDMSDPISAN